MRSALPLAVPALLALLAGPAAAQSGGTAASVPTAAAAAEPLPARYPLVPWPAVLEPGPGEFRIDAATRIALGDDNAELRAIARDLAVALHDATGVAVPVGAPGGGSTIELRIDGTVAQPEGYRLVVTPAGITLSAAAPIGLFYGVQTLRQLLPAASPAARAIPAVSIEDAPRFQYRGMHLDVGRHFFPVSFIKRYIDLLATYKINTFHWHLTEDQGWRIQIERYPRLTEVGAFRRETVVGHGGRDVPLQYDGKRYGGFYTQDEIRDVVAHAAARYVTIIPEIELPGHSVAALAAYPELACTQGPFEVMTKWGVSEDIYCPTEQTFEFLQNVLTEVMALFPGEYIHIGGDEAPKKRWEESPVAQEVIRRERLADEHELQSWFIRRIETFLNANGRKLIGWDEIMDGGLSPTATMMFWRNWATVPVGPDSTRVSAAKVAASRGNDIIMTPNNVMYFDHYQADPAGEPLAFGGLSTLHDVYAYEPVPVDFTPDEASRVIGAQANMWTEYITTSDHAEYMLLPRMLALAEVVWSPRYARDWASFAQRVPPQLRRLDALDVNYRRPYDGTLATLSPRVTASGGATPARATPAAADRPRVIGYLASWGVRSKGLRIRSIAGDRLTHIFYAFGDVTEDGTAALGDPCLDIGRCEPGAAPPNAAPGGNFADLMELKRRFPHLRLMISLGGWGGSQWFSDAAATPAGRQKLVASTIDVFLRPYPGLFDGVDVDWEFPVSGGIPENRTSPDDRRNFTLLMEEYRRQLDALGAADNRRYELAMAASARPAEIANLELDRLAGVLDFINVMTYDYHSVDTIAHFNAPLRAGPHDPTPALTVDASMNAFLDAGVPAHQLVVGVPFYGRGYGGVAGEDNGLFQRGSRSDAGDYGEVDYREIVRRRPAEHGFRRYWHADAQVPWLYNADTRVFFSYDGPDGVRAKADYVRAHGFGGIMFWELGGDDGTLLRVIDSVFDQ
ncbi:MAG TPA: family 20 glycosylhydrolase [Longimicrobiales bacterium]|nr:family 20 glycosylhydrolase [Longimicrobiales bacterium]